MACRTRPTQLCFMYCASCTPLDQEPGVLGDVPRHHGRPLYRLCVAVVGARGLGAEVAKNLVLSGVGAVTLHDEGLVAQSDLGANLLLREEDVGRCRGEAVAGRLTDAQWGPAVEIGRHMDRSGSIHMPRDWVQHRKERRSGCVW